ncbi:MAG: metalloregulator ArsR/SmtB family transcription factor [Chloroflexota bacterium]|nr:metalloregulator ArsR/SmtB family transcription factor [Chloroflexota bacterium]
MIILRPDQAIFEIHADFCSILSNTTRIMIMWLLVNGEKSVTELADALELSIPNVSQHLRIMRDKGAVLTRKEAQNVYYRISNPKFIQGYMLIREGILEQSGIRMEELSGSEDIE